MSIKRLISLVKRRYLQPHKTDTQSWFYFCWKQAQMLVLVIINMVKLPLCTQLHDQEIEQQLQHWLVQGRMWMQAIFDETPHCCQQPLMATLRLLSFLTEQVRIFMQNTFAKAHHCMQQPHRDTLKWCRCCCSQERTLTIGGTISPIP